MASVEQPELHVLVGLDVGHELGARPLPGWPSLREAVLDHPLRERLGHDRPSIARAQGIANPLTIFVRCRGNDPVNHGRGAGDLIRHEAFEFGIAKFRKPGEDLPHGSAVRREVITGEYCKRRHTFRPAAAQRFNDEAESRPRSARMGEVMHDIRVGFVQGTSRWVVAIALLGHCEGHNSGLRIGHHVQKIILSSWCDDDTLNSANHTQVFPGL